MDGEYDVFDPKLTDDMVALEEVGFWVGQIDIIPSDIEAIKSYGTVLSTHGDGPKVNCTFVCMNMTFPHLGRCSSGLPSKGLAYTPN